MLTQRLACGEPSQEDIAELLNMSPRTLQRKLGDGGTPYKEILDETRRVLESNSRPDYRQQLEKELKAVADSEMWQAGKVVRSLRPERVHPPA